MNRFNYSYKFSAFQRNFINETEAGATFNKWVDNGKDNYEPRNAGPFFFIWFQGGKLHSQKVGIKRKLSDQFVPVNTAA